MGTRMVEYGIAAGGAAGHGGGYAPSHGLDQWAALTSSPTVLMVGAALVVLLVWALR